jgi:hypothetical protein
VLLDIATSGDRNVIKSAKTEIHYNKKAAYVQCRNRIGTNRGRGKWNHLKIVHEVQYLNVPGMLDIKELHKTATLDAAHC